MKNLPEKLRLHAWPILILAAVTIAVYGRIAGHEFLTVWDDNQYVTENPSAWGFSAANIRAAFSGYYIGNYAPVQILSYMLDYTFWGLHPAGYLITNIIIHLLNGLLVYLLLYRFHADRTAAFFAASLFLLHPVQVESVAWISQRKNLLSLFFMLISWWGYCRYRDSMSGKSNFAYAVSLFAFLSSLLAKSMTVVFPVMLILYDRCFPQAGNRFSLKDKVPYLLAAAGIAVTAIYSEHPDTGGGRTEYHGGSLWTTVLTMLPVFCRYLRMVVWPSGLSAEYAPDIHRAVNPDVMAAAALLIALALATAWLFRIDKRLGFWVAFFWIGLLPMSQLVPMLSMINDRYLYLPMVGATALAGIGISRLLLADGRKGRLLVRVSAGLLLLALAVASYERCSVWHDSVTLFRDVVEKAPASDRGWRLLAEAYLSAGKTDSARLAYEQALAHNPDNQTALVGIGTLLNSLDKTDAAYSYLQRLVRLSPDHAAGWAALGDTYAKRGEYRRAESAYGTVLKIQPNALPVYLKLGDVEVLQGHFAKAIELYTLVESRTGNSPDVAYSLLRAYALAGRSDEALNWLERALQRGYNDDAVLNGNRELASLWGHPRFNMLMNQYLPEGGGR